MSHCTASPLTTSLACCAARTGCIVLALLAVCTLGGCGIVPYLAAQFAPPEKSKPVFDVPPEKKVLVFIESDPGLTYVSGLELVRADLAEELGKQLVEHKVAASTISQNRLQNVLEQLPERASNAEIGKKAGADLVFYVQIEKLSFQDVPNTTLYTGRIQTSVKIIDVNRGRVFPVVETEYPVKPVELPPSDDSSPTYGNVVAKALAIKAADKIAKLFYEYDLPRNGEPISME